MANAIKRKPGENVLETKQEEAVRSVGLGKIGHFNKNTLVECWCWKPDCTNLK